MLAGGVSGPAAAHGFGALYNLPVPFWLYGWTAGATVVVSFLIAALFLTGRAGASGGRALTVTPPPGAHGLRLVLAAVAVFLLGLCIATGYFGNRDPVRNFSMPFFWVIFLLLLPYLTVLIGNVYALLNPWQTLAGWLDRVWRGFARGRVAYPERLGDWPALVLYLAFIWFELFGTGKPRALAEFLTAYTLLNLAGVWLVGARAWFRHCELFAVFLRLVGHMAPIEYAQDESGRRIIRLRWPFAGLLAHRPAHLSTVVFALAMLSTTAFDGLAATQWWVRLFWGDPTGLLTQWAGAKPVSAIGTVRPWFIAWETVWLLMSPFLYLGLYLLTIRLAKLLTGSARPTRELALDFGFTLLPIAVVYHITHYATLILTHGLKVISLASDPFGRRWDLFGTALQFRAPILPDMGVVWHSQVGLILLGHIISIWLAHVVALRVFGSRWLALRSQLPMLVLMVAFTVFGLWILAQPLTVLLLR